MALAGVVNAVAGPSNASSKGKTKAKKRYLKAKRDRRKNKRKTTSAPSRRPAGEEGSGADEEEEGEGEGEDEAEESADEQLEVIEQPEASKTEPESTRRPKKRRKLSPPKEEEPEPTAEDASDAAQLDEAPAEPRRSPTPPAALPAFPLPSRPDAPSKATLALQGLDKAIIEAELVDPRMTVSITSESGEADVPLSEKTRRRLNELGITELFAVQTAVIPFLMSNQKQRRLYLPHDPPHDICVSAPTGSGKTLAYVLPIIELLSSRIITRLRALVVLPTRDLVTQVRETFEAMAKGRGLKIGTATGQHSFAHEQSQLVADRSLSLQGGSSKVDILICTPGRLIDHLNGTPNFSLQHLRFLVIDEADRLLAQSFQDWLAQVLAATRPSETPAAADLADGAALSSDNLPTPDGLAPAFLHTLRSVPYVRSDYDEPRETSCQKLLFSATLTRDPSKIAALNLRDPKYFVVQGAAREAVTQEEGVLDLVMEKFSMPATLAEHMVVCDAAQKPLVLFHLVHTRGVRNALVFTKSAESTTRLVRLFEFFEQARAAAQLPGPTVVLRAYSSDLAPSARKEILDKFKNQEIHILVCSDLISRGIDISHVSHVVSYDAPVDMRKYVHRVGRTARAGRAGDAWTLVEEQEARFFKNMLKEANHLNAVKRLRVAETDLAPLTPSYENALAKLKEAYTR
ncbi:DEAD/DEAH box helicase [Phanerochaete sordida]|uniref:ATP-dependent RNA helicase n=1 Tax=Phanerochaete sordida TaxID=48140 RepID=A0A9P3GKJ3_9APHY|nr:DEAD/DEAH box helicase [Phanerochaete sordida]